MTPRTAEALLTLERDAALAGPEDEVWRLGASGPAAYLRGALRQLDPGGDLPVEPPLEARDSRRRVPGRGPRSPFLLSPADKLPLDWTEPRLDLKVGAKREISCTCEGVSDTAVRWRASDIATWIEPGR